MVSIHGISCSGSGSSAMKKQDAIKKVRGLGYSYFYDSFDERSLDDTQNLIQEHIHMSGDVMKHWGGRRVALEAALEMCSDSELDQVLLDSYGYLPHQVSGGSRAFFEKLLVAMSEAIKDKEAR